MADEPLYDGFGKIRGPFKVCGNIKYGIASALIYEGREYIVVAKESEHLHHIWASLQPDNPLDGSKFLELGLAPFCAFEATPH